MKPTLAHAQSVRLRVRISRVALLSWFIFACGSGPVGEIFPPPAVDELGLTEKERAAYSPITF
ncbi:MAG: hypothetical protein AAEJ52_07080, partial [Myxococcota bacterium]